MKNQNVAQKVHSYVPQELPGLWWYKPMENDKGAVLTQSINQHKKKIKAYNLTHIISLFLSLNLSELITKPMISVNELQYVINIYINSPAKDHMRIASTKKVLGLSMFVSVEFFRS